MVGSTKGVHVLARWSWTACSGKTIPIQQSIVSMRAQDQSHVKADVALYLDVVTDTYESLIVLYASGVPHLPCFIPSSDPFSRLC